MARTRYVKIGFFRNEALAEFGPWHRLLFEGLWLLADRSGRLEDRAKRIKADLFPYDAVDVEPMLADLAAGPDPFIRRYEVEGRRYIAVLNFNAHQRPHHKEPDSKIPEPPETLDKTQSPDRLGASTTPETSPPVSNGEWGMGNGELEMGNREPDSAGTPHETPEALAAAWNELTTRPIPQCRELTDKRKRAAKSRLKERSLDEWRAIITRINQSPFCRGETDRGDWVASFDFLLLADTAVKVLEGKYDSHSKAPAVGKLSLADIKRLAHALGSRSWAYECLNHHGGSCGSPETHDSRMAVAS